ncbi:signal peptidase I [Candidatus Latescibacterota bacterium]
MTIDKLSSSNGGFTRVRKEWIEPILIAFILAALIKMFLIQPFKIPSSSMEDTLLVGDQLIALKFLYGTKLPFASRKILKIRDPRPGDVIVFRYPEDPSKDFIKRCVAIGGQTIEVRNKKVFVDNILQELPGHAKIIDPTTYPKHIGPRDNYPAFEVPMGHVFVMGDNRDNSNDSRYWGTVPVENIKGKAVMLYWSWNSDYKKYKLPHSVRWSRFLERIK